MGWYHGSQAELSTLRVGGSITQNQAIARAFSHRPSLVSVDEVIGLVKHDGTAQGFLYEIDEPVHPSDIYPHPHPINDTRWEWLTTRELRLRLIEQRAPRPDERLSDEDLMELRRRQAVTGKTGSFRADES